MDDDVEQGEEEVLEFPSYSWTKDHAVADLVAFATAQAAAVADYMSIVQQRLSADSNFKVDQDEMHQQMTKEIETLPTFQEPEKS